MSIETTIYIPSHNSACFLTDAINSVLAQLYDSWELLLINNNSTDDTSEIFERYSGDERIHVFSNSKSSIPSAANMALSLAKGKYIIRLDADDIMDPNMLLVLANYLNRNPDITLVYPDYYLMDEFGHIISLERKQSIYKNHSITDVPPNGACTLFRTDALKAIGGYNEELNAQDGLDVWTRLKSHSRISGIQIPLFYYRRHGSNLTGNTTRVLCARREIKNEAVGDLLKQSYPISAIIPCRKNYDFTRNLWNCRLNGRTLLERCVDSCLASTMFTHIIVTGDDESICDELRKYNDSRLRFEYRSQELTVPTRSILDTLSLLVLKKSENIRGISVVCYLQSPFVHTSSLEESVTTLLLNEADSAFAVEVMDRELFLRGPNGFAPCNRIGHFRTESDIVYANTRSCLAIRNRNLLHHNLIGSKAVHFIVSRQEAYQIESKRDLMIAQYIDEALK